MRDRTSTGADGMRAVWVDECCVCVAVDVRVGVDDVC